MSSNDNYVVHDGSLYDYTSGNYCGVLVKEHVMQKLVKLQKEHLHRVKQLLIDEADKENVFPSMWTLHNPDGKQTTVKFIDTSANVKSRINAAVNHNPPKHEPLVFIASSMDEARAMADARLNPA